VGSPTEASMRLQVTDLLLSRLPDVRVGRFSGGLTSEQRAVLERIEAALEAHRHYFYPMVTAKKVVTLAHGAGRQDREGIRA
jgi:hypothetical protein